MNPDINPFNIEELIRLVKNLIRPGIIRSVDYDRARARVQMDKLTTDWLPWLTTRASHDRSWWAPEEDEQVVVLSPCGELAQGFILPTVYQDKYSAPQQTPDVSGSYYKDGAQIQYDREQHHYNIYLPEGGTCTLHSPAGINMVGDVHVEGSIKATADITDKTRSMAADRDIYNSHLDQHHVPPKPRQ
ncbi:phage baseplate assembly protein V [Zooshikella sp. RANM57]|uniref:phage baseplate assembly protein V n=1 Tax=Zooshikella sp. RANM57 TaxID=3425863 RepID=UPI003D6FB9FB